MRCFLLISILHLLIGTITAQIRSDEHKEFRAQAVPFFNGVKFPDDPALTARGIDIRFGTSRVNSRSISVTLSLNSYNPSFGRYRAVCYYYFWNESLRVPANALRDYNGNYRTKNGNVAIGRDFSRTATRVDLDIPLSELHLKDGTHYICIDCDLFFNGKHIASAPHYLKTKFRVYTVTAPHRRPSSKKKKRDYSDWSGPHGLGDY